MRVPESVATGVALASCRVESSMLPRYLPVFRPGREHGPCHVLILELVDTFEGWFVRHIMSLCA